MPKLDRNGNIIKMKKPADATQSGADKSVTTLPGGKIKEVLSKDLENMVPVRPAPKEEEEEEMISVPVLYDFILHCATYTQPDIDMAFVCENCPFKPTVCVDTMLLPDEEQMEAIALILMRKKPEEVK